MDCIKHNKRGVEILTDYCAGNIEAADAAEIQAHIQLCEECRTVVEAQCAVWETLDAWTPVEVSRDFDARLYARIAGERAQPAWRRWWSRIFQPAAPVTWWKPAASLAAAGAIVSLALLVRMPQQVQPPAGSPSAVAQSVTPPSAATAPAGASADEVDLQQVQQALDDLDIVAPANPAPGSQAASSPL